ncbi:hypothetical protein KJ611_04205 [Patescibacteria group bacterium]|nr:hypothetical protein [Patescibacteria group bacterium]MBU1705828.1 hypothetical protein [Patescibacteria group bacterium]
MRNIIKKIDQAGLVGRGGAEFPTARKWQSVKDAPGKVKYVVCNASEGELGLFKDIFILEHHLAEVMKGMVLAMDTIKTKKAYFNLNQNYHKKIKGKLGKLIKQYAKQDYEFEVFVEHPSYIGGEETALLDAIEGKRTQPRLKPPYPSDAGLFGAPTLINNVETFYNVALVAEDKYKNDRFCCLTVDGKRIDVYRQPADWSLEKILRETGNYPDYDFFVQVGGSASGVVYNQKQLSKNKLSGAGSLEVYRASMKPHQLLSQWFEFYAAESCGKCAPCRQGTFNLWKLIDKKTIDWKKIMAIVETMEKTSFCGLGKSIGVPVRSYLKNVEGRK